MRRSRFVNFRLYSFFQSLSIFRKSATMSPVCGLDEISWSSACFFPGMALARDPWNE